MLNQETYYFLAFLLWAIGFNNLLCLLIKPYAMFNFRFWNKFGLFKNNFIKLIKFQIVCSFVGYWGAPAGIDVMVMFAIFLHIAALFMGRYYVKSAS